MLTLWPHQERTRELGLSSDRVYDTSDPGCVSCDTEFLTPTGWKRIDEYTPGDLVATFHPTTFEVEFLAPLDYIKKQCSAMYHFAPARGVSMMLSAEHRVLHYPKKSAGNPRKSWKVDSTADFINLARGRRIASTFTLAADPVGVNLSDAQLRLMVACIADGHFNALSTSRCTVRLKKEHKIVRLRALLHSAGIEFQERECPSAEGFHVFSFYAPRRDKVFTSYYWNCSQEQLDVVADEVFRWDGSKGKCFFTTVKESADFIQYAITTTGNVASIITDVRDRTSKGRGIETLYTVHKRQSEHGLVGGMRPESIHRVRPTDGHKYCFTTPTSFWIARHNNYIFATGNTGKTSAHLSIFDHHRTTCSHGKALVVCPKSLMASAWGNEIRRFFPHLTYSCAYAENREEAFEINADIYIINTDGVKWLADKTPRWLKARFGENATLIVDEMTAFKHRTSQRSKALVKISKHFTYRRGLTGTPYSGSVTEMWNQIRILDEGQHLGTSFQKFQMNVCAPEQVGPSAQHIRWVDIEGINDVVAYMIKDISIRHDFQDVMDIPENYRRHIEYELSPKARRAYNELAEHMILQLSEGVITAVHAASLRQKLLQTVSGAVYTSEGEYTVIDDGRYELVSDLIEERKHSIVFFNWKHQKDLLTTYAKKRGIEYEVLDGSTPGTIRAKIVSAYQEGAYQTLFLHPQTGSFGLTLTRGTATIWASPNAQPDVMKQGLHRVFRGGQKQKTENITVEAKDTVERLVYERLLDRQARMFDMLDLLKEAHK